MSSTTIAYSHKGGFWKTKYTFVASWMARVGKLFYSGDKTATTQAAWRHNSDTAQRTAYYIAPETTPIGSGISVSFNKNVSQNKIYKSFSLEGSNNISGANSFVVNQDSGRPKVSSVGPIKDIGGILYGHIGLSTTTFDGSNISLIGEITSEALVDPNTEDGALAYFYMKGSGLSTSATINTLFFGVGESFYNSSTGAALTINSSTISSAMTGAKLAQVKPSSDVDPTNFSSIVGGREVKLTAASAGDASAFKSALDAVQSNTGGRVFLYEMTSEAINGAPPRGQYAQLNVALGYEPYELYALNLNYEPTDLDHSK